MGDWIELIGQCTQKMLRYRGRGRCSAILQQWRQESDDNNQFWCGLVYRGVYSSSWGMYTVLVLIVTSFRPMGIENFGVRGELVSRVVLVLITLNTTK